MIVPQPPEQVWVDDEAGPVVRHYARTSGRTRPTSGAFDLITIVMAARAGAARDSSLQPEHTAILGLCQNPISVAELATRLDLPVGTVRVLLGDLLDRRLIRTRSPVSGRHVPNERVFKAVLDGLRSL